MLSGVNSPPSSKESSTRLCYSAGSGQARNRTRSSKPVFIVGAHAISNSKLEVKKMEANAGSKSILGAGAAMCFFA